MNRLLWTAALVACVPCATLAQAPASAPVPAPAVPSVELARVLTDYETIWSSTGGMKLAELFTEDGFVLSGGRPPIRGRAGIAEYYSKPGGQLSLRALAYATEGSVGYIIGGYTDRKGNPDIGKFTLTLRKVGGRWLIVSDMDNGNQPPRRPPQ